MSHRKSLTILIFAVLAVAIAGCGKSGDKQARKRVKVLRQHMEQNDALAQVFPHLHHHVHKGGRRPKGVSEFDGEWNWRRLSTRAQFAITHLEDAAEMNRAIQLQSGVF